MNRIKELRKKNGYTVKTLATQLGLAQSMLTNYENGSAMPRNQGFWTDLAAIFAVSEAYLMGLICAEEELLLMAYRQHKWASGGEANSRPVGSRA